MSQVRLTLRPPENVDFVQGYPGIPSSTPERPQASVRGAVEVWVPPQGVKAKWVRIELRKVETLPGGKPENTYYDPVAPSPINLWSAQEEYELLKTRILPFSIRIPETLPPTVALEDKAGIGYELVASVCTKGKRSWFHFRRAKSMVVSTETQVTIDKHDLHTTWPVYCQPETKNEIQDGVIFTVRRQNTCFGPGDRISVLATLKSESASLIHLHGFDIALKEVITYKPGHNAGKKTASRVQTTIISDDKLVLSTTLAGGSQHQAELVCLVPSNHTTTTLKTARHIDVVYTLQVRALMGSMQARVIGIDLQVIMSNWQRHVSVEAIRRIGYAPTLSLAPTASTPGHRSSLSGGSKKETTGARGTYVHNPPHSRGARTDDHDSGSGMSRNPSQAAYSTVPSQGSMTPSTIVTKLPDEMGYGAGLRQPLKDAARVGHGPHDELGGPTRSASIPALSSSSLSGSGMGRRSESARAVTHNGRFAVSSEAPPEAFPNRQPYASVRSTTDPEWMSAEDEKRLLYERARARVEMTQGIASPDNSLTSLTSQTNLHGKPSQPEKVYLTAEQEKRRFEQAWAAAQKTQQSLQPSSPPHQEVSSSGAAQRITPPRNTQTTIVPQYPSAKEEKAAMERYARAQAAVEETQRDAFRDEPPPITYASLYPESGLSQEQRADSPPPFDQSSSRIPADHLSEKARMQRAYEAQDVAAMLHGQTHTPPPQQSMQTERPVPVRNGVPVSPGVQPTPIPPGPEYLDAAKEKALLRAQLEAKDRRAEKFIKDLKKVNEPNNPRNIVTANDEEALLGDTYAAEEHSARPNDLRTLQLNGTHLTQPNGAQQDPVRVWPSADPINLPPTPTPPPLMPKPPKDYIKETQEEDARVARIIGRETLPHDDLESNDGSVPNMLESPSSPILNSPVSAFKNPGPPPPLTDNL